MKIKRPLFLFSLSVLVVINLINILPGSIFYCSLALFVLFVLIHRFTKNKYTHHLVVTLLAAVFAIGSFSVFKYNLNNKIEYLSGQEIIEIEGTITNKDNTSYTNCYHIKIDRVNGKSIGNFKVAVYTEEYLSKGDRVVLSGKYKHFTPTGNYLYRYSQGIFGNFYADKITVLPDESGLLSVFSHIRTYLTDKSRKIFDYDTVSIAVAMGFGDKSLIDQSVINAFKYTGISHALVVSGLHIGFIVAVFNWLMYYIPVHKKLKNIVLCLFIVVFMGIIGFTPSIIRAGCLIIALTMGRTFIIEIDNYTVLAVIILLSMVINPYSANNGSLLLSYVAYFGVVQAAEICSDKNYDKVKSLVIMSVFATLYTTPVLSALGMNITILSPLFNLLLTYIIMVICVLSFFLPLMAVVPFGGMPAACLIAPVNDFLIRLLLKISELAENNLSFAMIDLTYPIVKVAVFSIVIAIITAFIQFESKRNRVIFTIIVPVFALLCYNFMNRDVVTVKVFDGSSEPSYIVQTKDNISLIATENINSAKLETVTEKLNIDSFDAIVYCSIKDIDKELYSQYSRDIKVVSGTESYATDVFTIDSSTSNRQMCCVIEINGVKIGFNHNKGDMSDKNLDFYFFGSSTPKALDADNCYYFYPVIKKNIDLVTEKQAVELYDILTIKIRNGKYTIVEDVKNFGSRI